MTTTDMLRKLEKLDQAAIKQVAIEAVLTNADIVISDAIVANNEGLTFAGNEIAKTKPFTDWEETGQFHGNLEFKDKTDIEFVSYGDGAEAIFSTFPTIDTIAPTAKIMSSEAIKDIKVSFRKIVNL